MNSASEFQRLLAAVRGVEATNFTRRAALATIVRTQGSTFRRAGASMLVHEDAGVVCALSGGCPENDIVARARKVITQNRSELARYNDAASGDLLFEAGCGGELDVLIEPLAHADDTRFLAALERLQAQRRAGFMATVFAHQDQVLPRRPQRLIWCDGIVWNEVVDAQLAARIVEFARAANARAASHAFESESGRFEVLFEALYPAHALTAIGANAAALALAECARSVGWNVCVVDHRDAELALPEGARFIKATPASLARSVPLDAFASVVVMTFNIERDLEWLRALAQAPLAYLGAIGSRERALRMRAELAGTPAQLHAPAGLDIGSETPEEIALAVSAEILAVLNAREGRSLAGTATPIHP